MCHCSLPPLFVSGSRLMDLKTKTKVGTRLRRNSVTLIPYNTYKPNFYQKFRENIKSYTKILYYQQRITRTFFISLSLLLYDRPRVTEYGY